MGLTITVKGLPAEDSFDNGYITFNNFRAELAKAYNPKMGTLYEQLTSYKEDIASLTRIGNEYNRICSDDLDIFLFHSDCDGKITWQEAGKILKVIKPLSLEMYISNYGSSRSYNLLDQFKKIFEFSHKNRRNIYFY